MKSLINTGKFIFSRFLCVYVLMMLLYSQCVDKDKAKEHANIAALNRLRPSSEYFFKYMNREAGKDQKRLNEYIRYYENVLDHFPLLPSAQGMLGYFHYESADAGKAKVYFQKAIEQNPNFFWYYYNLALIHYKAGDYPQAIVLFQGALNTMPKYALAYMRHSRVYSAILNESNLQKDKTLLIRLKEHYNQCFKFLILCHLQLNEFQPFFELTQIALQDNSPDPDFFYYYAGLVFFHSRDFNRAAGYFKKSIEFNPAYGKPYEYLGLSLRELQQDEAAQEALLKAKELNQKEDIYTELLNKENLQML